MLYWKKTRLNSRFYGLDALARWGVIRTRRLLNAPNLAAGVVLLVYLRTLAPTVFDLDSAELTLGAFSLGLVHAPGYPVYLLLAHLFTYLPLADIGYRVNLLSALSGAATVALLARLAQRLTQHSLTGLVVGLTYGFCFYVWSLALVAEVYTLQSLFLAAILLLLWQWQESGQARWLLTAVALSGVAAANNPSTILWWPGLLILAWATPHRKRLTIADCALEVGVFVLALSPVLYLPLRSAAQPDFVQVGRFDGTGAFHPLDLTQIGNLLWYLSGRQFAPLLLRYTAVEYGAQALQFFYWLWAAFLGVGLPLGLGGAWILWKRQRAVAAGLFLTALPHALFFIGYRAVDKETMFLPVFLIWALLLGVGVEWILSRTPKRTHLLALLLPAALLWINFAYADVSDFRAPSEQARDQLLAADTGALYLATWGDAELMRYHQIVAGLRPDVEVVNRFFIAPADLTGLIQRRLDGGRTVYSTYELLMLPPQFVAQKNGSGYHILLRKETP